MEERSGGEKWTREVDERSGGEKLGKRRLRFGNKLIAEKLCNGGERSRERRGEI